MKTLGPFVAVAFLAAIVSVEAAPKHKGQGNPAAAAQADPSHPAEALAPYIKNLDQLLALRRAPNKALAPLLSQASGGLVTLRLEFVEQEQDAPPEKKPRFAAAINTCDLLSAALDDRQKVAGDLAASGAVKNDGALNAPARKDNLTEGIHGDWVAKAVGTEVELARERSAENNAARTTSTTDHALNSMAESEWNQRAIQWRQKISGAYSGIL